MIKASISWNVAQIAKATTLGSMSFSNEMQRGHVWDIGRKSKLIDSLLRGYVVPALYTVRTNIDAPEGCKKDSKVFDCIDGKQRSEAIRAFLNDEFALVGLDEVNGVDINGKKFSELDEKMQKTIKSYTMTVYYFSDISDDEISEMMARLNNGKPLTGVENARIKAKQLANIIALGNHGLFKNNLSEANIKAYHNEDIVMKTVMQIYNEQFELSTKNVRNAYINTEFTDEMMTALTQLFDRVEIIVDGIKEKSKKIGKLVTKKTNLVGVLYFVYKNSSSESDGDNLDMMADFLMEFFNQNGDDFEDSREKYNEAMNNGTNHTSNVVTRNEAMQEAWEIFG